MKNLSTKNCWKLLGGVNSLLICAGSLAACLISNNNQNQIKQVNNELTTNNEISNELTNTSSITISNIDEVRAFLGCDDLQDGSEVVLSYEEGSTSATILGVYLNASAFIELNISSTYTYLDPVTSVTRTYNITSIGEYAFWSCTNLTSIEIPSSVSSIGAAAFYMCSSLASIEIPKSVKTIGQNAFAGCASLNSISIPSSVTSIGWGAFGYCDSLTDINIPSSVTSIGNNAFLGCTSLSSIYLNWATNILDVTDWNGINTAPSSATIYIPFGYGSEYSNYITGNIKALDPVVSELYTASASAFFNEAVDETVSYHFDNEYNIIIDSVSGLGDTTSLTLKENLNWNDLESYYTNTITPKLVGIGASAFGGCSSLESINIPSSVSSIGAQVFYGCTGLTSITLNWTAEQLNGGSLSIASTWLNNHDITKYTTVYIPEGTTEAYEQAITDGILNFDDFGTRGAESEGGNWDFVDDVEPTPEPSSNSNIGLAVGLGVGLGVPAVGGIGFGTYYGVKRKKEKK